MSWIDIINDVYIRHNNKPLLVGVHPSYGQQLVDKKIWGIYQDGFTSAWYDHKGPRLLIPSNRNKDYYLAPDPDYEIAEFPSGLSAVRLGLIRITGSTIKKDPLRPNGCVDNVIEGLIKGQFTYRIEKITQALLYL
jgi:hypothetical protein